MCVAGVVSDGDVYLWCVLHALFPMVTCIYGVCVYVCVSMVMFIYGNVYLWCVLQALFPMMTCIYGVCVYGDVYLWCVSVYGDVYLWCV